jgi:hypothetical protein
MLTVSEDEDDLLAAMKAGASGYVLKGAGASELISVIRSVHGGDVYLAPTLAWGVLRELSRPRSSPFDDLTQREREVLELSPRAQQQRDRGATGPRRKDHQALHDQHPGQAPGTQPCRGRGPRRKEPTAGHSLTHEAGGDARTPGRSVIGVGSHASVTRELVRGASDA